MKKILSLLLALSMVMTLLPVWAMAEETDTLIGASEEIIGFAPLTETEKTVAIGTSSEDLDLPEALTITVRTAVFDGEASVQDSGSPEEDASDDDASNDDFSDDDASNDDSSDDDASDDDASDDDTSDDDASDDDASDDDAPDEDASNDDSSDDDASDDADNHKPANEEAATTVCDIPVTWTCEPEYNGDTAGIYVFTPVIDGYKLADQVELPQITVTVGALMAMMTSLADTTYEVWVNGVQVTSANKDDVLENGGTVRYTSADESNAQMLTLNGATITNAYESGDYKSGIYANGQLELVLADGTNNTVTGVSNSEKTSCGIYATESLSISGDGSLTVSGGAAAKSYGLYSSPTDDSITAGISFSGTGSIIAQGGEATDSYGMFAKDFINVLNGTVTASGESQAINVKPSDLSSSYTIIANTDPTESGAQVIDSTALDEISTYKYLKFNLGSPAAKIGSKNYASIEGAVEAVKEGEIIQLLKDVSLTKSIILNEEDDKSFTIDLNGKKISISRGSLITHKGSGTLTVKGGTLSTSNASSAGNVFDMDGSGKLIVDNCTVENLYSSGTFSAKAIYLRSGTVSISNSTLKNKDASNVISVYGGYMSISNSNVLSTRSYNSLQTDAPILNVSGGTLTISGGTVTATDTPAILADDGTIYIIDGAKITSRNPYTSDTELSFQKKPGTIYQNWSANITIADSTVENTTNGWALFHNVNNAKPVFIGKGNAIIKGGYLATNLAPTLRPGMKGMASANYDGSGLENYDKTKIDTYKYLEFKIDEGYIVAKVGEETYTDLQAAVDAVGTDGIVQLVNNLDLTNTVNTKGKSFTLDLNGKTLDSQSNTSIEHTGGTLTIMDGADGGGGTITSSGADSMIKLINDSNLIISSGKCSYEGTVASAIHHESSGSVEVNGGTVQAVSTYTSSKVIYNVGSGDIHVNGGTVIHKQYGKGIYNNANGNVNVKAGTVQSMSEPAIYNYGNGTVNIFDGATVYAKSGYYASNSAIYNNANGAVNISGGTVKSDADSAIFNNGIGKITISGNAEISNKNNSNEKSTIVLNAGTSSDTVLEIKGGTISNEHATGGYGIYNKTGAKILISSGLTIIKCRGNAMNTPPEIDSSLRGYGSSAFMGNNKTQYDPTKLDNYQYLQFQLAAVPDVPTYLTVTQGNRQLSLSWTAPSDDGGRDILRYEYTIDDGEHWNSTNSIEPSFVITSLEDGTECKIRVRAVNELGPGPETVTITKTFAGLPDKITDVVLTPGNGKLTLTCKTPYNGGSTVGYEYSKNGGESWIRFISHWNLPEQTFDISPLTNGTPYTIIIRAFNDVGKGEPSDPVTATPATVPGNPTINTATAGNGQIEVVFTPSASNGGAEITEYRVTATPSSGDPVVVTVPADEVTESTKTVVVAGLTNGKSYTVKVTAYNNMGSSVSSNKYVTPATIPGKPTDLVVQNNGSGSLKLTWTAPDNGGSSITKYQYSLDAGTTWSDFTYTSTSQNIGSLTNGTTYTIMIRAVNNIGESEPSDPVTAAPAIAPDKPIINTVTAGNGQIEVVFTPSASNGGAEITEYKVTAAPPSGDPVVVTVPADEVTESTKTVVITGLINGKNYTITVKAINRIGSATSDAKSAKPVSAPGKPTDLVVENNGSGSLKLTWTAPNNNGSTITKYQYSLDAGATWNNFNFTMTSQTLYSLTNGTTYTIMVRAVNDIGEGEPSDPVTAKPVGKPHSPSNLKATVGDRSLILTWQAPANNGGNDIEYYEYSIDSGEWTSTGSADTTYTLTGLTNGTSYTVQVRSFNSFFSSDYPPSVTAAPAAVPDAPTNLNAISGNGKLNLSWTAPTNDGGSAVTGYQISTDGGLNWVSTGSTDTTYIVTGLINGTSYTVKVRAVNIIGGGTASSSIEAKPGYAPTAPINLQATAGNESLQLKWDAPTDNGGNAIVYYEYSVDGGEWTSTGSADTTYTLTGLANGTPYTVKVRAFNSIYSGAQSSGVTAAPSARPNPPTNVTATAGDSKATVSFTLPVPDGGPAITSYIVTSSPGGITVSGTTNEIEVTGLTNGTSYTFTVRSVNSIGESLESDASNSVTPKANQTINFEAASSYDFGTTPTLTATASSGLTVTFTSLTPAVCTIENGVLTFLKAGTATIQASQAGNGVYNAATPVSQSFTVNAVKPGAPTSVTATAGEGKATVSFTAPASNGGVGITGYTVTSNPGGITASGTTNEIEVTGLTNGTSYTFMVTATNSVGTSVASLPSSNVTPKANQTINFETASSYDFGTTPTLTATASSGLAVTFTSLTPAVCTIENATLTFLKAGTATIQANQAGNGVYNAATPVSHSFTVNAVKPGAPTSVTATAGNGKATVSFTPPAFNGGVGITGYAVTSNPGGITSIGATNEIEVIGLTNGTSYTFTVRSINSVGESVESLPSSSITPKANQTINFETASSYDFGTTPTLTATASSGLTVTFTSLTPAVCTIENGVLTFLKAGTAKITASQAGDNTYLAATPVTQSFTVNPVSAGAPTNLVVTTGDEQLKLTWTAPVFTGGSPIDYYMYSFDGGATWTSTGSSDTNSTVTGLTNGTEYTVMVCAYTNAGNGAESGSVSATPYPSLTGIATINNTNPKVGDKLNGSLVGGSNTGTLSYVWKAGGAEVGTGESYTVTLSDLGKSITLEITSDVETGTLISAATAAVQNRSSNSDSGGSSNGSNSIISTVTDKSNSPTQGEIKVPSSVDGNGNAKVNLTSQTVTRAYNNALAQAKKNGTEQNGITLVLRVDTGSKPVSNVSVNLPKTVQDTIIAKRIVSTIVVVDNPHIRIGMDLATVKTINTQAKSDVNVTATRTNSSKLFGESKNTIGSRPVFDLKINYGSGKQVQNFGTGRVSVAIPYTLGANEKPGNVQAVYVDTTGRVHWITNSVYDSAEKVLRFTTDHFSTYGVGYKQPATAFTDIATHWAKEDIEFAVSRGLISGTTAATFSPNAAMTRGMFAAALGRLANIDVSSYKNSSFTDVKNDAYYMGYIEWTTQKGILSGMSGGEFAPDQAITREQIAVIMQNYAKVIGFTLPKVYVKNTFADSAKISANAKDAVKQMQMAGVISSKNNNLFDPQAAATRAEISAMLHRFVKLTISSDSMQGWTRNDSGKWMCYVKGKPVTGKKVIGGTTYTFNQYGVIADLPKKVEESASTGQKIDSL